MRIVIDFTDPVNDLDFIGLPEGQEPASKFGKHGAIIWRLFSAAVRSLFLAQQTSDVAQQALNREWNFIEERIREYRKATNPQNSNGGKRR